MINPAYMPSLWFRSCCTAQHGEAVPSPDLLMLLMVWMLSTLLMLLLLLLLTPRAKPPFCTTKEMINPVHLPARHLFGSAFVAPLAMRRVWSEAPQTPHAMRWPELSVPNPGGVTVLNSVALSHPDFVQEAGQAKDPQGAEAADGGDVRFGLVAAGPDGPRAVRAVPVR